LNYNKYNILTLLIVLSNILYGIEVLEESSFKDGLYLQTKDAKSTAHIDLRVQTRFSTVDYDNDFGNPNEDAKELKFNRVRFKLGGTLGATWLKYYTEYDFVRPALLDMWIAPKVNESLHFRIGQYKVPYNRERFDSSGKQQFAERSIVTPSFTLDRQIGITVMGRLFKDEILDTSYYTGIFFGTGRDGEWDSAGTPMLFARWQWNIFQKVLPFSRSDISRHKTPIASLAIATASYRGAFTKFSTSGAGALEGLNKGEIEQYDVEQFMIEFSLKYKGFSIQSEYHKKYIDDSINMNTSTLSGFYCDVGYFFSELIEEIPKPLELMLRYASVNPDTSLEMLDEREVAVGVNWYFYGHRDKLTFDVTQRKSNYESKNSHKWGMRLQWDVSF
jgi:phosphate-selective porin